MTASARHLIDDSLELASLPAVVMQAVERLNDPDASATDISRVISQDPSLSTKLLKIVNSAFYGFPSRIDTISRAITVVGTLELTDLILGATAIQTFAKLPNQLIDMDRFWAHSLYTGIVSRLLARQLRAPNLERCFITGLLHDIGALIIYRYQPEQARQALELARQDGLPLQDAEQSVFGFDHAEVGAELMAAWHLPETFIETTRYHHAPSKAVNCRLEAATVHLADVIAGIAQHTGSGTEQAASLENSAWDLTGLSVDIIAALIADADAQFDSTCSVILPRSQAA